MKIESDMLNKFLECYNESKGVALCKKYILKTKKNNNISYFTRVLLISILLLILSFVICLFKNCYAYYLSFLICFIDIVYLIQTLIKLLCMYNYRKKSNFKN